MTTAPLTADEVEFASDIARIHDVLARDGIRLSGREIAQLWRAYSASLCAQWMMLPSDDETLYRVLLSQCASEKLSQAPSDAMVAVADGPTFITDHGSATHVLLTIERYQELNATLRS